MSEEGINSSTMVLRIVNRIEYRNISPGDFSFSSVSFVSYVLFSK